MGGSVRHAMSGRIVIALCGLMLLAAHSPARADTVNIFFAYESTEVSETAGKLLDLVKQKFLKPSAQVTIAGHTDTAEPNGDKLSLTRALEVEKALIALGVPAKVSITIVGRAATVPMDKTGANVREPQNRRVTIDIK